MPIDVYADVLFLINFSMDYLCLYILARVLHKKMILWRLIAASALGGIYSVLSLLLNLSPVSELFIDCLVCAMMCTISFFTRASRLGSHLVTIFLYVGISMMTGGCMTAIFNLLNKLDLPLDTIGEDGISTYLFALLAAIGGIISLKSGQIISKKGTVRECRLTVSVFGREFEFLGFSDSGNLVRDPISGRPIIFLDRDVLEGHCSLSPLDDFREGRMPRDFPTSGFRLISYSTASGSSMTVAMRPDRLTIEYTDSKGKKQTLSPDALIAPTAIGKSAQGYNAIVPSEIITR